tara:strand:- start:999 stop:1883 length:885 start_codon:yes stop_codon:yes gene_type:complete
MVSILDALEERLLQNLIEQETKKNWDEWLKWLSDIDGPVDFEKPINLPDRRFSFQTLLSFCEKQLIKYPDWQARFSTPEWLLRQQIFVIPKILKKVENQMHGIGEIAGLSIELTRLIDQIHNVQQLITSFETGTSNISSNQLKDSSTKQIPSIKFSHLQTTSLSDPLGRPDLARTLERELQLKNKGQNSENISQLKDGEKIIEPDIVPLKEAYLSFNSWCDQFEEVHLDLQEFVEGSLRVLGSHQISFQQFSHRILKKAINIKELKNVLDSFSRLRSSGVDKNLEEKIFKQPKS